MEILTKHGFGDRIWTLVGMKAAGLAVSEIFVREKGGETIVEYIGIDSRGEYHNAPEDKCFPSKEELLRHISDGNEAL